MIRTSWMTTAVAALVLAAPSIAFAQGARRSDRAPSVGDLAPDFELRRLEDGHAGDAKVRLSSFRGERPVALIFGSYT